VDRHKRSCWINPKGGKIMAREHTFKSAWGIKWELTGDILDRIDIYDHVETVTGVDEKGREWEGSGLVSCGDLVEVDDAELIEENSYTVNPEFVKEGFEWNTPIKDQKWYNTEASTEIDLDRDVPHSSFDG
jgi:hypothetical protein